MEFCFDWLMSERFLRRVHRFLESNVSLMDTQEVVVGGWKPNVSIETSASLLMEGQRSPVTTSFPIKCVQHTDVPGASGTLVSSVELLGPAACGGGSWAPRIDSGSIRMLMLT